MYYVFISTLARFSFVSAFINLCFSFLCYYTMGHKAQKVLQEEQYEVFPPCSYPPYTSLVSHGLGALTNTHNTLKCGTPDTRG